MSRMPRLLALTLLAALIVGTALFAFHAYESRVLSADENRVTKANAAPRRCPQFKPSPLATKYLENLHGIEIGASTQNSFGLKRSINVDFSDEQGGLWQDKACVPAVVNIVALGDNLPFKDNTLDYVLTSHVIEHFFDPIKALKEWHRVIKPGGYIFIIAPHKDRTFDKHREATPTLELFDRFTGRIKLPNYARPKVYDQSLPHKLLRGGARLEEGWTYYEADDHHHWSVWRTQDFVELVKLLKFNIVEIQDVDDKVGNGFTVVIRK
jgi:SAM-dependent methyltransferase